MKQKTQKTLIKNEENRLIDFLKNKKIDNDKLNIALDIIHDIAYLTIKSSELMGEVEKYGITEEYQNGANQKGRKKSASYDAYLNTVKQKSALIKQLTDLLPNEEYTPPISEYDEFDEFLKLRKQKNESDC